MIKIFKYKKTIIIIAVLIVFFILYKVFSNGDNNSYILEEVSLGRVVQEVSETGTVNVSEQADLGFKTTGKIQKIYVKEGDKVLAGERLISLNVNDLALQLEEAQANLLIIKAERLDSEQGAYKDARNYLDDIYLKVYNAANFVNLLKRTYFDKNDPSCSAVVDSNYIIKKALKEIESYVNKVSLSSNNEDVDTALTEVNVSLLKMKESLKDIRDVTEGVYHDIVSTTDKSTLDTHRLNINTAIANIATSQQTISNTKLLSQDNQDTLYQAKIKQAEAKISLLQNQIQDSSLRSPAAGDIIKVFKKEGEIVSIGESLISFLPESALQIEVDIYEEDIVKVKIGDPVDIILVAFPDEKYMGQVVLINPAEKMIDGVVYYEVKINLAEEMEEIKPGMTADILIKTGEKDNVLVVSKKAVKKIDGKNIVKVLKNEQIEEREIQIGLKGEEFYEVLSGLEQGEQVIIGNNNG